jgi:hypothetical protein
MPKGFASTVIDAPIDEVWARIRDFNGLPDWHPGIAQSEIEEGKPSDQIGCVRSFTYDMQKGPMSWWNYVATMQLKPVTDGNRTYVEWSAEFDAKPEDVDGLIDLVENGVFQGGFDALKAHFNR